MKCIPGVLAVVVSVLGLAPGRGEITAGSTRDLQDGYFLMHETCDQEAQVAMLNIIKTTPPDVADYLKRVQDEAKAQLGVLDRFKDADPSLAEGRDPLSPFERANRNSIRAEKQHLLLFGSKAHMYARRVLFAQIEASTYLANLALVWSQRDKNSGRVAEMREVSAHWMKLRDEGYRLLDEKP